MKIVVLAGGTSTEREISIVSGTGICKALRERGHKAILVDIFCGNETLTSDAAFEGAYDVDAAAAYMRSFDGKIADMAASRREFFGPGVLELCRAADVVFLGLHGANGEDGKVQAAFELLGIPYTGAGHLGSAIAMDKNLSKQLFRENGVPTPKGAVLFRGRKLLPLSEYGLKLPCVVKACCGGSSVGVYIVNTEEEYQKALEEAFSYDDTVILEEYIKGREFSVGVVDKEAYPVIEIAPLEGFYDYKNKYQAGSTVETCPAELPEEITAKMQKYAIMAFHALHLESYARMDFLMDEDQNLYCLEANTLPGMTPTSLLPQEAGALGISYGELCEKLIQVSLKRSGEELS